jgi:hypothetical protein
MNITNKNKRLVFTSVNQLITLLKDNPDIATKMPRFAPLAKANLSVTPKKACNCGAKQNIVTPDVNKQVAEGILSSLTQEDFLQIKNILALEELCYYKRNRDNNKLELICV